MSGKVSTGVVAASPGRPLRRRIRTGILGVTVVAVLLFALPLGFAVSRLYRGEEIARLQRDATRVVALVPDNPVSPAGSVQLPTSAADDPRVGLYTPSGARVGGHGPSRSALAAAARDGRVHQGTERGQLVVTVPVPSDTAIVAVVRTAVAASTVTDRTRRSWAAMALLGLVALGVAGVLARREGRRIAAPLERLTGAARALGDGNFAIPVDRSGIREADAASEALRDTAAQIGKLLERERAFSADASHQLRTPLTGLLLGLESALDRPDADLRAALDTAITRGRHLQTTIDDLLSLRRDGGEVSALDLDVEVRAAADRWRPQLAAKGRGLAVDVRPAIGAVNAAGPAVRQILDVLIGNALEHGTGTVSLTASDVGDAATVEVSDEGAGLPGEPDDAFIRRSPDASGHGIGLALARSLAEAEGGRLLVRHGGPRPVFALLLRGADTLVVSRAGDQEPTS
ncbi:MAG: HAMP domain-containing sensor histidine kinase [Pseudonocardiales bacterium]